MLQKTFGDESISIIQGGLKIAAHMLTGTPVLAGLHCQKHWKTSNVCDLRLKVIIDWLLVKQKMIYRRNIENHNLYQNCARLNRKIFALKSLRTTCKWSVMIKRSLVMNENGAQRKGRCSITSRQFRAMRCASWRPLQKLAFEDYFKVLKQRWERVVQSNEDYFEGCHVPDDEE